ncbi:gasdermin-C-like isoform X2 [Equus caballus]|uniref:gasdermin-C-like isoform X2 n=1 Tax=Equus caballus TaxID=9796 RepID=UPI0038B391CC
MFKRTSKNITKEIGGKDLRPVKNFWSATEIQQFSLLRKRKTLSLFLGQREYPAGVSLMDILEPISSVPEPVKEGPFLLRDAAVLKLKAGVSVNSGVEVNVSGEATESYDDTLQYQIVTTPFPTWTELQKRKVLDPEPSFLKQCRETGVDLYVVTETVELLNSPVLQETSSGKSSGLFSLSWNTFFKGEGAGECLKVREKELTLQKGMVMAYKRKQLVFKENGWDICHISDDDKKKTFPEDIRFRIMHTELQQECLRKDNNMFLLNTGEVKECLRKDNNMFLLNTGCTEEILSMLPIGRIEKRFGQEFKHLQEEVSRQMEELAQLTKGVQDVLFHNIPAMLGDQGALQELMDMLEQEPLGHLSGPGGTILNELRKDSSYLRVNPKYPIIYLLEAILVLSDIQHDLLAQSKEKRILLHQRELVRSILEPNFSYPWNIPFTLKPELLAPLQGEGLAITYGLLEECGLKMQLDSPRSTWGLEAKKPLSALYGTLSMLQQLAEA